MRNSKIIIIIHTFFKVDLKLNLKLLSNNQVNALVTERRE